MNPVIVVHHHEITLKRENRGFFERHLLQNIRAAVRGLLSPASISGGYGRFVISLPSEDLRDELTTRLKCVFGLANICIGVQVEQSMEQFIDAAKILLEGVDFKTIKVDTRRPDKNFPIRSMEVNARVGEYICREFNVRANLSNPDETLYIEIVDKTAFVYCSKVKGAGGLPTGSSGRVVSLLSAGFDSPVASWQLMKRGASVIFVHFHSMPYTSQAAVDQVRELVERLTRFQLQSKLYLIPFADVQNAIVLETPQSLRVILYRRMMIRIAEEIVVQEKAEALVTGEAVGQVASQTLRNIRAIDQVATYPVLRPLSGMDKEETIAIARSIGTFDTSSQPYDDCCSFLAPRRPETWADLEEVERAESKLNVRCLVQMALGKASKERFAFPKVDEVDLVQSSVL